MRFRVQDERKPVTPAEIASIRPVVEELAADLRNPAVPWNGKRPALAALQHLRQAALPAVPALVETLDLYREDNGPQGVGHFCEVTRALEAVAPRDERSIRAVAAWLKQNTQAHSICHRCGCALKMLETAGPAAREIAGPVVERLAASRILASDDWQLGRTVAAMGIAGDASATLMARVQDENVSTYDRAETLLALGRDAGRVRDSSRLLGLAAQFVTHPDRGLREAAAETLGALGPPALDALRVGLRDAHYKVRARSAASLARLGAAAAPAAADLVTALDPFRGTAREAIAALAAIGPPAASAIQTGMARAPDWLRPLLFAAATTARTSDARPALEALSSFTPGPGGHGFVRVEVRRAGRGAVFVPGEHRATLGVKGGATGPGTEGRPRFDVEVNAAYAPNTVFHALAGRREGDAVTVLMSPEIAQSPISGTDRWQRHEALRNAIPDGAAAAYEVEIRRVCRPIVWRFLRGSMYEFSFEVACVQPSEREMELEPY
jgi:hypothetical protein